MPNEETENMKNLRKLISFMDKKDIYEILDEILDDETKAEWAEGWFDIDR